MSSPFFQFGSWRRLWADLSGANRRAIQSLEPSILAEFLRELECFLEAHPEEHLSGACFAPDDDASSFYLCFCTHEAILRSDSDDLEVLFVDWPYAARPGAFEEPCRQLLRCSAGAWSMSAHRKQVFATLETVLANARQTHPTLRDATLMVMCSDGSDALDVLGLETFERLNGVAKSQAFAAALGILRAEGAQ